MRCSKQAWLWMQGDIYRAKQKERMRDKPEISRILSGVDDMKIHDNRYRGHSNEISYEDEYDVSKENEMLNLFGMVTFEFVKASLSFTVYA